MGTSKNRFFAYQNVDCNDSEWAKAHPTGIIRGTLMLKLIPVVVIAMLTFVSTAKAGPYTEPGINAFVGSDGAHACPTDPDAIINPIFRGWASGVASYEPTPQYMDPIYMDPIAALGPPVSDGSSGIARTVSLGDLDQNQINQQVSPGQITLTFDEPNNNIIRNGGGYDFVVFENGFTYYGHLGIMFAELAYVEVSSNGIDFARFPSVSLTPTSAGLYGWIDGYDIYNLAGKHPNNYTLFIGTSFDLSELTEQPLVLSETIDLNNIRYVRIVDIPGSGDFGDQATEYVDPNSWPSWQNYGEENPIFDPWVTWGSGGFDLDAVGVLYEQQYSADINLDGVVDMYDLSASCSSWLSHFGQDAWLDRYDLSETKDLENNLLDFSVFARQWLKVEQWRTY